MAETSNEVALPTSEYRPCLVKGRKALFHRWEEKSQLVGASVLVGGHKGGEIRLTLAIIEYEGGNVAECYPYELQFLDDKFKEYCFKGGAEE